MAVLELQRKIYPGINFSDPGFRIENAERNHLNVFLNDSQFLLSIVEPTQKETRHIQSFNFFQVNTPKELNESIRTIFETEDLLSHSYKSVNFAIYNDYNTLIPGELFDATSLHDYLFFNFDRDDEPEALHEKIGDSGIVNVYGVDKYMKNLIESKFPEARITHSSTHLIDYLINASKDKSEPIVYAYVQPKIVEVICVQKGQLKLFNSFYYSTPEDFVYYLLYSCQNLNLDPESLQLFLLGEIVKDSVLYEYTYKYIRNVQFGQRPVDLKINAAFKMPEHFYFNLFCMNV